MKIRQRINFVDLDTGAEVISDVPIEEGLPLSFWTNVTHPLTIDGRTVADQFQMRIPADNIEQAFERLPECIPVARQQRVVKLRKENPTALISAPAGN